MLRTEVATHAGMQVFSFFVRDLAPEALTVEYSARFQIPGFQILGLPAPEIQEARERIISAFQASGLEFPKKRILINLAPASIRKSGTGHDLAIAMKILSETIDYSSATRVIACGELGLDGTIRPSGKMGHLIELLQGKIPDPSGLSLILGTEDHAEFNRLLHWRARNGFQNPDPGHVMCIGHLRQLLLPPDSMALDAITLEDPDPVSGSPSEKTLLPLGALQERVLKIASVGRHHTLLLGPKGVGKSASMDWFRALAAPSAKNAAWERALYQESRNEKPDFHSPIRQVHSQVRPAHLLGSFHSGAFRAGELSLAHGGMFFADEFPEWPRDSKECLREPLQSESFQLTSVRGTLRAKCDLQLIGSGNLCPCGGFPARFQSHVHTRTATCRCSEAEVRKYLQRLSGPILDRIDLWAVFSGADRELESKNGSLETLSLQVSRARLLAHAVHGVAPARIPPDKLERLIPKSARSLRLLNSTDSLRDRHKLVRIACSIAALEGLESPDHSSFDEALSYRMFERII
ncbi:MAG: ATP-binding protein [Bdellovibrionales bacterium]|nr:ATP-binding protein [Bdellovibrionales bacterium]